MGVVPVVTRGGGPPGAVQILLGRRCCLDGLGGQKGSRGVRGVTHHVIEAVDDGEVAVPVCQWQVFGHGLVVPAGIAVLSPWVLVGRLNS